MTQLSDFFPTSWHHLQAELNRLDLLLQLHRQPPPAGDTQTVQTVQQQLDERAAQIESQREACQAQGVELRLDTLAAILGLSPFEMDAVLICLAPELDIAYGQLYAELAGDARLAQPTVNLILQLLIPKPTVRLALQSHFEADAPLRRLGVVSLGQPGFEAPLLSQPLRLNPRIRRFLLEEDQLPEALAAYAQLTLPWVGPAGPTLTLPRGEQGYRPLYLHGPAAVANQSDGFRLTEPDGRSPWPAILEVHGERLTGLPPAELIALVRSLDLEARLQSAVLFWRNFDLLFDRKLRSSRALVEKALGERPFPTILAGERPWQPAATLLPQTVSCTQPTATERLTYWQAHLGDLCDPDTLRDVAGRFRLAAGQIRLASRAVLADYAPTDPPPTLADLLAACRQQTSQMLSHLGQKISPQFNWDDLILPADQMAQLHQLCDQVHYQAQVYESWGFGQKLALGQGLGALFTGEPGTGKTMAAAILAGSLGLELYKVDLSAVVSKYIGETEKNLAQVFAEAEAGHAILFFDEADALFGKRTEVRDSHDRYANLEISYLLQRMESFSGLVILASNLRENLDRAFVRRLRFIVEFPLPDEASRLAIWQGIWPDLELLHEDVDLPLLARHVDVAGGHIRNIALAAAFLAAAGEPAGRHGAIRMSHIRQAIAAEYSKIGKLLTVAALK